MQRITRGLAFGFLAVLIGLIFVRPAQATATTQSTAFPMYEYPTIGTLWADINAAGSKVPFMIVNPGSGPGASVDPTYTSYINGNTAAGQRSIGYVHANYHARPIADVLSDIDTFYQFYPAISGIFVDLIKSTTAADVCYVATLHNYIKSKHPAHLVVVNPGVNVPATIEPYSDIFLNAENYYSNYTSWAPLTDGFENNAANAARFWHLIHTVNSGQLANALALSRTNNAGWVTLTDATMPNPYNVTPGYWSAFLTSLASLPQTTIPNRGLTALPAGCMDLSMTTSSHLAAAAQRASLQTTVTNTDATRVSWGSTKITYTEPAGTTLAAFGAGTGWSCSVASKSCTYNGNIAANTTLPDVWAEYDVSCSYANGATAAVTVQNFAANTATTNIQLIQPHNCASQANPNSAGSDTRQTGTTARARAPAQTVTATTAPTENPSNKTNEPSQETPPNDRGFPSANNTTPHETNEETKQDSSGFLLWAGGAAVLAVIAGIAFALWRRSRKLGDGFSN